MSPQLLAHGDRRGHATADGSAQPVIEGYRIDREIGRGRMSTVYLADDEKRGGKTVLKVLSLRRRGDEMLRTRFFQEYAILSAIKHEHVVRIFEQGFGSNLTYIAMEYLSGGALSEIMARGIAPHQAMSLLSQAASALGEVHRHGIVHRDVKPANFLLRAEGVLVLTDFGVAKRLDTTNPQTVHGEVLGTVSYMAPEQAQSGQITAAADIYSLGVICFEMLCGRRPFIGHTIGETISQHIMAPVPRLPEELAEYQTLVDGMLAKRPENRFGDAAAVLGEIDRIRTAQSVRKPSP